MKSSTILIASFVLLAFHRGETDAACTSCSSPALSNGLYIPNVPPKYDVNVTITVACDLSYVATGGSATGVCTKYSNNNCTWNWGGAGKLQCTEACQAPVLTTGTEFASSISSVYILGDVIQLQCSTGYASTGGAVSATCLPRNTWEWNGAGMLQCTQACQAPVLTTGTEFASSSSSVYFLGDVIELQCSTGYASTGGVVSATCFSGNTWQWNGTGMLQCTQACQAPLLTTGTEFASSSSSVYILGNMIEIRCSAGYASTGGAVSATCLSGNTWQWNGAGMLQCTQGCSAPTLTQGVEYESGDATTVYLSGSTLKLKCSTTYGYKNGSYSGTCGSTLKWIWDTEKQLECDPVCSLPTLSSGVQLVSSTSATYILGSTITVSCILDYGIFSGSDTAACGNNHIWDWTSLGQLQCRPTCLPPATGSYATISTGFSKAIYLLNQTIQYECESGYVPLSGGSSGMCSSINRWTWQAGASAPLRCVIAPPYKDRRSDIFKPATCKSYVIRKTPTSATCLISCLNDGYCRGYSFDGSVCHLDRPFIEAAAANSMNCLARENSQT